MSPVRLPPNLCCPFPHPTYVARSPPTQPMLPVSFPPNLCCPFPFPSHPAYVALSTPTILSHIHEPKRLRKNAVRVGNIGDLSLLKPAITKQHPLTTHKRYCPRSLPSTPKAS
ncbi:hypothetical protein BaRGS_00016232 [Batillaria attramentaria]|uniref:Uncharacterized protein n=1 Tax=Batillaria attramentaria TaxID=370345 RepID=A0ABD0KZ98_9CAEN